MIQPWLRRFGPVYDVVQIVHSFVLSRLDYGNFWPVCQSQPSCRFNAFRTRQRGWSYRPMDERSRDKHELHWLGYPSTVEWSSNCTTMHAIHMGQCTVYDILCRHGSCRRCQPDEVRTAIRRHRSCSKDQKPRFRTEMDKRAFSYAGPLANGRPYALPPPLLVVRSLKLRNVDLG